jgi:uncharacterized protein YbaR (Trm112 family)
MDKPLDRAAGAEWEQWLDDFRCPRSGSRLRVATSTELAKVHEALATKCEGALVSESGLAYPIDDGIPILIADRAVAL